MLTSEQKTKIIEILETSIKNLKKNINELEESAISDGILNTLNQITEVDSLVAKFMHTLKNHETACSCDDDPFTDEEYAKAVLSWLEHMRDIIISYS